MTKKEAMKNLEKAELKASNATKSRTPLKTNTPNQRPSTSPYNYHQKNNREKSSQLLKKLKEANLKPYKTDISKLKTMNKLDSKSITKNYEDSLTSKKISRKPSSPSKISDNPKNLKPSTPLKKLRTENSINSPEKSPYRRTLNDLSKYCIEIASVYQGDKANPRKSQKSRNVEQNLGKETSIQTEKSPTLRKGSLRKNYNIEESPVDNSSQVDSYMVVHKENMKKSKSKVAFSKTTNKKGNPNTLQNDSVSLQNETELDDFIETEKLQFNIQQQQEVPDMELTGRSQVSDRKSSTNERKQTFNEIEKYSKKSSDRPPPLKKLPNFDQENLDFEEFSNENLIDFPTNPPRKLSHDLPPLKQIDAINRSKNAKLSDRFDQQDSSNPKKSPRLNISGTQPDEDYASFENINLPESLIQNDRLFLKSNQPKDSSKNTIDEAKTSSKREFRVPKQAESKINPLEMQMFEEMVRQYELTENLQNQKFQEEKLIYTVNSLVKEINDREQNIKKMKIDTQNNAKQYAEKQSQLQKKETEFSASDENYTKQAELLNEKTLILKEINEKNLEIIQKMENMKKMVNDKVSHINTIREISQKENDEIKQEEAKKENCNIMLKTLLDLQAKGIKINFANLNMLKSSNGKLVNILHTNDDDKEKGPRISFDKFIAIMEAFLNEKEVQKLKIHKKYDDL